ncbi:MAG TPA: ABC transporter ATP-binding protein [Kiritimatiellia bacterium]|nr:ABC transporter ATP-binding protein [Kiritimatiellia bacterium]HRU69582.1 ABC transporter ATP-binding protein [Kiritimatiellia bacterium]
MNGADVQVTNVVRTFAMPGGVPVEVLRGLTLLVRAGECVAVTGPSGSGKTTLLQLIGALDRPDCGEVRVNGRDLARLDERERCKFRNREVGFVFQSHHLLPQLTALGNVLVPAWGSDTAERCAGRARDLLERVGLADRCDHFPGQLSGGERQRVAVARALVMRPCLVLADEPTGALDRRNAAELMAMLLALNREEHTTLIVVTHDETCAQRLGRCVPLRDGRIMNENEKG